MCRLLDMSKTRSSPYHPQSNGLVERFTRTLLSMLSLFVNENQTNWDCLLPYVMMAYRSSVHASTGFTPYKVLFGREIALPLDVLLNLGHQEPFVSASDYVTGLADTLSTVVEAVKKHQAKASGRQKELFDFRAELQFYSVGELVWAWDKAKKRGICPKLQQRYRGPYRVLERLSDVLYRMVLVKGGPEIVVHYNRHKPYVLSSVIDTSAPTVLPQVGAESQHHSEVPLGASWVHRRPPEVSPNLQKEVLVSAGHRQQPVQEPELQEEDQDGLKEGSEVAVLQSKVQRPVRDRRQPVWAQDYEMAPV
ncbi:Retrovirus-related Pol poly from transposon [Labeo rohita]|uniref:Retrovirus-related Pol poly from transposon n=1 Tax=Labeo rohita TaxID=84645 RepID=A0A498NC38_LABRO|nr:Retrovirus-related Pol poly from transposon [Labeo rohita]